MKTAKKLIDQDGKTTKHWLRVYFGFMLFFALMLALILSSCSQRSLCHSYDNYSYKKQAHR